MNARRFNPQASGNVSKNFEGFELQKVNYERWIYGFQGSISRDQSQLSHPKPRSFLIVSSLIPTCCCHGCHKINFGIKPASCKNQSITRSTVPYKHTPRQRLRHNRFHGPAYRTTLCPWRCFNRCMHSSSFSRAPILKLTNLRSLGAVMTLNWLDTSFRQKSKPRSAPIQSITSINANYVHSA